MPDAQQVLAARPGSGEARGSAVALAGELRRCAELGWALEDDARRSSSDTDLARIKRRIDENNGVRSRFVGRLDHWSSFHVHQVGTARLHTESFGTLVDRLVIAGLRAERLSGHCRHDAAEDGRDHAATLQRDQLARAYDDLLGEVAGGRVRFPAWQPLKQYGGR
ncbi:MAG: DUF4254 domain-containing protein [Acidimicrobiales bacterium]|nr:DUF4254 domain-containing protein [Acidimicrobiales bacterium]